MGYYTNYELEVEGNNFDEVKSSLEDISGYGLSLFEENIKWYNHEKDIVSVSKMFPNDVIYIKGIGEEYDDQWHLKCKNGKLVRKKAIIAFPEISDEELE